MSRCVLSGVRCKCYSSFDWLLKYVSMVTPCFYDHTKSLGLITFDLTKRLLFLSYILFLVSLSKD